MYRNQYDNDVTVFSPQGRLHQIDYAMEAMKQGSVTVGIKSDTHAVLVALKRAANTLSAHQKKIYELDEHLGLSMAGLLSDGRILARFIQAECASHKWDFGHPMPIQLLSNKLQLKLQGNTQYYGRRPFGVGLIFAGYDAQGAHIVKADPSADVVEVYAASIGARSQSARTYLEGHFIEFANADLEQLVEHALLALRDTLPADETLTNDNTSISIVGRDQKFKVMEDNEVEPYLQHVNEQQPPGGGDEPEPME
jgi:20S proteasome subunit alpha 6